MHYKKTFKTTLFALSSLTLASCMSTPAESTAATPIPATTTSTAPNIVYMIGDGMGFEYISAYRYAMSTRGAGELTTTPFDELLRGAATTYPDDDTWVTDSAAGATALATGVKSYNGAIGIDAERHPQQTLMEKARAAGWLTGAVSTSQVTHATPASFFTHHPSRNMYNAIADSLAEPIAPGQWSFDVLLGGGYDHFQRDDVKHLDTLAAAGMAIATDFEELAALQQTPALAVLAPLGLPHAIDAEPRLATLTDKALQLLTQAQQQRATGKPFALMIEGSQIDWCGHANDIACAVHEMADFAAAIEVVLAYQEEHPNTLLVITADHSTGGLALGRDGVYEWLSERVMQINASIYQMTADLLQLPVIEWRSYLEPQLNLPLTEAHWQKIMAAADILDLEAREEALNEALVYATADLTGTGWTTGGHTAVDVPVMAAGPYAEQFRGYMDHTEVAKALLQLVP